MVISAGYNVYEYSYHFLDSSGAFLWRKDKSEHHPDVGETHIHRTEDRGPDPYPEVDLIEVLDEIHAYHERGERP